MRSGRRPARPRLPHVRPGGGRAPAILHAPRADVAHLSSRAAARPTSPPLAQHRRAAARLRRGCSAPDSYAEFVLRRRMAERGRVGAGASSARSSAVVDGARGRETWPNCAPPRRPSLGHARRRSSALDRWDIALFLDASRATCFALDRTLPPPLPPQAGLRFVFASRRDGCSAYGFRAAGPSRCGIPRRAPGRCSSDAGGPAQDRDALHRPLSARRQVQPRRRLVGARLVDPARAPAARRLVTNFDRQAVSPSTSWRR